MKKLVLLLIVLMAAVINFAYAQDPGVVTSSKPGWHKIGETTAKFEAENESILVLGKDKFKSIKIKVTDAPINIESVQVFYENGEVEEVSVKNELKAGAETRSIDLKGGATQELKKVVFVYKTLPNSKDEKAHVELYGLK
jgi:hypothetical protein